MIKNIILINSANFNYLDVNLEKDLFFLGGNGSGKTTVIRAIHYLFSGDVRNLGIPTDKDGFKEHYFRYPNSYMIYVFDGFFIFMYKTSGEIVKLFSKQKFERSRIIDENSNLYELDAIKKYTKEANLRKTVKSLSQYRDIIYGNDKQLLDFKFTSIKNSDVFITLFNEIFNIDKSIIDSKSIKKAIQTTLSYENKVIDFNHEKYLQDIYTFQSQYKFFREFEKQKDTIDSSFYLKNNLLALEEELDVLLSSMVYRYDKEKLEIQESKIQSSQLEKKLLISKKLKMKRGNTLKICEEHFQQTLNKLSLEIQRIKQLKDEFSQENILISSDKADKYDTLVEKQSEMQESYIKLKTGFEDELASIKAEIKSLEYKRDKELPREMEDKKENKKRFLKSMLDEKIEKDELEVKVIESKSKIDIINIRDEIKQFKKDILTHENILVSLEKEYKQSSKNLNQASEKQQKLKKELIEEKDSSVSQKNREIQVFGYELEELQRVKQGTLLLNKTNYEEQNQGILKETQKYKTMIHSKPNSFKEFLNEEVDGWEDELYPLLDETILDMSLDALKPNLLDTQRIISLDIDTSMLKHILTKDEAQRKINSYEVEAENLKISYDESSELIERRYKEEKESIEQNIKFLKSDIVVLKEEIVSMEEEILRLEVTLEDTLKVKTDIYKKSEKKELNNKETYLEEIENSKQTIYEIEEELREKRRVQKGRVEDLESDFDEALQEIGKILLQWLDTEKKVLNSLIKEQELKKETITKDERVKELEESLKKIHEELTASIQAKQFLQKYEKVKLEIDSLLELENRFEILKLRYDKFSSKLEQKIKEFEYSLEKLMNEKKELSKKDRYLKKGLEAFQLIEYDFKEVVSKYNDTYLYELVASYNKVFYDYKNKKIDLKEKIVKLKKLENSQNEIDISFNLEQYDENFYISKSPNIVEKIDEILEYKDKKLEIVKESGNKKFRNFVNSSLPQNMSVFNDSEDKFLSQVAKINKNLAGIDFGVIKNIKLNPKIGDKKSVAKLLGDLNKNVATLSSLLNENSLFYEQSEVLVELSKLEKKFKEIKGELKGSAISLQDTIDLSLSFNENGKLISEVSQLKNESSTGGSMLLKIAIAISILQLFITEEKAPFFLIVDEVSRLHSDNQEKLRKFANSKGFGIVFVTPEPTYSKPEYIKYYRFQKNSEDEFEAIELNV